MHQPFGLAETLSEKDRLRIRRNDLRNLFNNYADEADVFVEMIQNAFDAVRLAVEDKLFDQGEAPSIDIFIGRRSGDSHYFCVSDNGVGMSKELAGRFTIPGYGARKAQGKTIGHKGVGASFFVAASNRFAFKTSDGPDTSEYTIENAYAWITNETEPLPTVRTEAILPEYVKSKVSAPRGTVTCVYLHPGMRPSTLSHVVNVNNENLDDEICNWASLLCLKTSLGQIANNNLNGMEVRFHLDIGREQKSQTWKFGKFDRVSRTLGYPYPSEVLKSAEPSHQIDKIPPPQMVNFRNRYQAITMKIDADGDELGTIEFNDAEQDIVNEHFDFAYLYFAYSTEVLGEVRDRLGVKSQFRYGIKIAVDGVPQGRMVDFALTSNQGLDRQMHAVISFKRLDLDTGRKIPANDDVSKVISKIGQRLVSKAKDYRFYMKKKERPQPPNGLAQWKNKVSAASSDSLARRLISKLSSHPTTLTDPVNESEVISLFVALCALGALKGKKIYGLSSITQYDGLTEIDRTFDELNSLGDPLSIRTKNDRRYKEIGVVEFKHNFDELISDFLGSIKVADDIDLLVCWDVTNPNPARGRIEYWYDSSEDRREVYGATHLWVDANETTSIPVISLRHCVAILLAATEKEAGDSGVGVAELATIVARDREHSI